MFQNHFTRSNRCHACTAEFFNRLANPSAIDLVGSKMKPCRECAHNISEQAVFCPSCGAPYPARDKWDGVGFEYKSEATLLGVVSANSLSPDSPLPRWLLPIL